MYLGPDGNVDQTRPRLLHRRLEAPAAFPAPSPASRSHGENTAPGKVTWADVCEPARRLAADGFVVSKAPPPTSKPPRNSSSQFAESRTIYLADGAFRQPGVLGASPTSATFARLQQHGPREFYEGETARSSPMPWRTRRQHHPRRSQGLPSRRAHAAARNLSRLRYRDHASAQLGRNRRCSQMLGMLEPFDVAKLGANSAAKYHLFVEVMRRAFRDRAEFLGDPDFVNVPTAGLLDRAYIAGLMQNFDPAKATPSDGLAPGKPAGWKPISQHSSPALRGINAAESTETTHYSIVDAAGNAVSNTYTLNGGYGSGVTIPGTGILDEQRNGRLHLQGRREKHVRPPPGSRQRDRPR